MRARFAPVCALLLGAAAFGAAGDAPAAEAPPVTLAAFGPRVVPKGTKGDTWDSAWLADGRTLLQYNDGTGFDKANESHDGLCELAGSPEKPETLAGTDLNPGKLGKALGATYSTGLYEADGVLYHNIVYSDQTPGAWRFYNGSVLKSADGGKTWLNHLGQTNQLPPNDAAKCMFPDDRWHQADFVKYGRGGAAPDLDNARTFVYLASRAKGGLYLARVTRKDLPALDVKKFQYFKGGDGLPDANWSSEMKDWAGIPAKDGWLPTTIVYNAALRRYVSVSFKSDSWVKPPVESTLCVLEAPHPWGPWTPVLAENVNHRMDDNLTWSYLLQAFGGDDGQKMWATASGRKPYGLQFLPVYLTTHPVTTLEAEDAKAAELSGGAAVASTVEGFSERGYVGSFEKAGAQCRFKLQADRDGTYLLKIRYHTKAYRTVDFAVNDAAAVQLKLGKSEQKYATWTEGSVRAQLRKGENTVAFRAGAEKQAAEFHLDRLSYAFYAPAGAKP